MKPRDEFGRDSRTKDGLRSRCHDCRRRDKYIYYHERGGREAQLAYRKREDIKERRREAIRQNPAPKAASDRAYHHSPRGRLVQARGKTRRRLRDATTDEARARLTALIAIYDRRIARMDAARDAELPELHVPLVDPARHYTPPREKHAYGTGPYRGVRRLGTRYQVAIRDRDGRQRYGGLFDDAEEAREAANRLAREILGVEDYAVPRQAKGA